MQTEYFLQYIFNIAVGCLQIGGTLLCSSFQDFTRNPSNNLESLEIIGVGEYSTLKKDYFINYGNITGLTLKTVVNDIEDGAFNGLKKLENLDLSDNDLPALKPGLLDNLPLQLLYVRKSNLENIEPHTFDTLTGIKKLWLYNNLIRMIRKGVFTDTNIIELDLSDNRIQHIEDGAFTGMKNLCSLDLSHNQIVSFDTKRIIGSSSILEHLNLEGNNISDINRDMFNTLPNLITVNLGQNNIHTIGHQTFIDTTKLFFLSLAKNKITELRADMFKLDNDISVLFLNDNRLTFLSPEFLNNLPHLRNMTFNNNPWQCSCLKEIQTWFTEKNIKDMCDETKSIFCKDLDDVPECAQDSRHLESLTKYYNQHSSERKNCRLYSWRYFIHMTDRRMCSK